jgi:hypothetical protein
MHGVLEEHFLHSFYPWYLSGLFTLKKNLKKNTVPDNFQIMQVETNKLLTELLKVYPADLLVAVEKLRTIIKNTLPGIKEQVDLPAKMIGFSYRPKYSEMVCSVYFSKKGLQLSFYRGIDL